MYCRECGRDIGSAKFCPNCGASAGITSTPPPHPQQPYQQQPYQQQAPQQPPRPAPQIQQPAQATEDTKRKGCFGCIKIALIALGVVIVIIVLLFIFVDTDDEPVDASVGIAGVSEIERVTTTATDLLAAYAADKNAAIDTYGERILEITGTIGSIEVDIEGHTFITLVNDHDVNAIVSVQCYFAEDMLEAVAQLQPGDVVSLSGYYDTSMPARIVLENCAFLD